MRLGNHVGCLLLVLLTCVSCAVPSGSRGALADIKPGQRPAPDSDEAGWWMAMDRVEEKLRTSGRLLTDASVNGYVSDIVCKVAGPYCSDIRVAVVQTPHFNAAVAPNGAMQVWTGLILRVENEAQLAHVLAHEIAHYIRRHALQRWRDVRSKTNLLVFFQVLTAAAGYGFVGDLAALVTVGSIFKFSRDNEREADEVGLALVVKAGYDPREAPKIWEALVRERDAGEESQPLIFFSTHPSPEERLNTLKRLAEEAGRGAGDAVVGKERFLDVTVPLRAALLRDELRRREFARTQVVLDRLMESAIGLGELHFFQGELYRLRAEEGDEEEAIAAYQKALQVGDALAETHRALGLVFLRTGEREEARVSFERYLQLQPESEDREMIKAYLRQLE